MTIEELADFITEDAEKYCVDVNTKQITSEF